MGKKQDDNRVIDLHEARERLLDLIGTDKASFTMFVHEYQDLECISVRIDYDICGVHYEKEDGKLKIIVNLNAMDPIEIRLDPCRVREAMALNIAENCPFLLSGTYHVYLDRDSIRDINREAKRREFKSELDYIIRDRGFTMDEMLPVVYEFVREKLPETSYESLGELAEAGGKPSKRQDRIVLEVTPPGVPCPHCSGQLSIKVLRDLTMKWYTRYHQGDDPLDW